MVPQLDKFPRSQKFLLADRIQVQLMEVLEMLLEAYYTKGEQKKNLLYKVNIALEKMRYQIRLAKDLRCIDLRRYEYIQSKINEIGQQVGAWLKSISN
ncbi:MAG: diversity-generating retroelement protein Avd [Saprospiraceae bacterium]|nr:diversity-generating retroelement protein Avd [Saprospiraceae bacterium]